MHESNYDADKVNPARAGMIRSPITAAARNRSKPRASGDDPPGGA